jgi:hypothetical protein
MIVVTVELKSAISRTRDRTLGQVTIANDGTGTATRGNYLAVATGRGGRTLATARVEGFPRRSRHALRLLVRALKALYPNE